MSPETIAKLRKLAKSSQRGIIVKRETLAELLDIAEARPPAGAFGRYLVAFENSERRTYYETNSLAEAKAAAQALPTTGEAVALVARVVAEAVVIVRDL